VFRAYDENTITVTGSAFIATDRIATALNGACNDTLARLGSENSVYTGKKVKVPIQGKNQSSETLIVLKTMNFAQQPGMYSVCAQLNGRWDRVSRQCPPPVVAGFTNYSIYSSTGSLYATCNATLAIDGIGLHLRQAGWTISRDPNCDMAVDEIRRNATEDFSFDDLLFADHTAKLNGRRVILTDTTKLYPVAKWADYYLKQIETLGAFEAAKRRTRTFASLYWNRKTSAILPTLKRRPYLGIMFGLPWSVNALPTYLRTYLTRLTQVQQYKVQQSNALYASRYYFPFDGLSQYNNKTSRSSVNVGRYYICAITTSKKSNTTEFGSDVYHERWAWYRVNKTGVPADAPAEDHAFVVRGPEKIVIRRNKETDPIRMESQYSNNVVYTTEKFDVWITGSGLQTRDRVAIAQYPNTCASEKFVQVNPWGPTRFADALSEMEYYYEHPGHVNNGVLTKVTGYKKFLWENIMLDGGQYYICYKMGDNCENWQAVGNLTVAGPSSCSAAPHYFARQLSADYDWSANLLYQNVFNSVPYSVKTAVSVNGQQLGLKFDTRMQRIALSRSTACNAVDRLQERAIVNTTKPTNVYTVFSPILEVDTFYVCYYLGNRWMSVPNCKFRTTGPISYSVIEQDPQFTDDSVVFRSTRPHIGKNIKLTIIGYGLKADDRMFRNETAKTCSDLKKEYGNKPGDTCINPMMYESPYNPEKAIGVPVPLSLTRLPRLMDKVAISTSPKCNNVTVVTWDVTQCSHVSVDSATTDAPGSVGRVGNDITKIVHTGIRIEKPGFYYLCYRHGFVDDVTALTRPKTSKTQPQNYLRQHEDLVFKNPPTRSLPSYYPIMIRTDKGADSSNLVAASFEVVQKGVESYTLSKVRPITGESFEITISGTDFTTEQTYAISTNPNCQCDYVVKRQIGASLIRQLPSYVKPSSATVQIVDPVFVMKDQVALQCGTYAVCFNSDPTRTAGNPDKDKFVRVGALFNVSCVNNWDLSFRRASYGLYPNVRIDNFRINGQFLSKYDRFAFSKIRPAGLTSQGYYNGDTKIQDGYTVDDWKTGNNNINYNPCHDIDQLVNVMSVTTCKNVIFNSKGTSVDVSGLYFQEAGEYAVCYEMNGVWYRLCGDRAETGMDNQKCVNSIIKIQNVKVTGYTASPRNPHSDCPWTLTLKGEGLIGDGSMKFGLSTQPTCSEGEYTLNDQVVKQPRFVYDSSAIANFHGYRIEDSKFDPYETAYGVRHREPLNFWTNITNATNVTAAVTRIQVPPGIYFVCFEHTRKNRDCKWERVPGEPISVFGPVYYDVPKVLTVCSKAIQLKINGFFNKGHKYEFSLSKAVKKADGSIEGGVNCHDGNRFRVNSVTNFATNLTQWYRKIKGVYPRPFISTGRPAFEAGQFADLDTRCPSLSIDNCKPAVGCDWDILSWKCRRYQGEYDNTPYATEFPNTQVSTVVEFDHSMLTLAQNDYHVCYKTECSKWRALPRLSLPTERSEVPDPFEHPKCSKPVTPPVLKNFTVQNWGVYYFEQIVPTDKCGPANKNYECCPRKLRIYGVNLCELHDFRVARTKNCGSNTIHIRKKGYNVTFNNVVASGKPQTIAPDRSWFETPELNIPSGTFYVCVNFSTHGYMAMRNKTSYSRGISNYKEGGLTFTVLPPIAYAWEHNGDQMRFGAISSNLDPNTRSTDYTQYVESQKDNLRGLTNILGGQYTDQDFYGTAWDASLPNRHPIPALEAIPSIEPLLYSCAAFTLTIHGRCLRPGDMFSFSSRPECTLDNLVPSGSSDKNGEYTHPIHDYQLDRYGNTMTFRGLRLQYTTDRYQSRVFPGDVRKTEYLKTNPLYKPYKYHLEYHNRYGETLESTRYYVCYNFSSLGQNKVNNGQMALPRKESTRPKVDFVNDTWVDVFKKKVLDFKVDPELNCEYCQTSQICGGTPFQIAIKGFGFNRGDYFFITRDSGRNATYQNSDPIRRWGENGGGRRDTSTTVLWSPIAGMASGRWYLFIGNDWRTCGFAGATRVGSFDIGGTLCFYINTTSTYKNTRLAVAHEAFNITVDGWGMTQGNRFAISQDPFCRSRLEGTEQFVTSFNQSVTRYTQFDRVRNQRRKIGPFVLPAGNYYLCYYQCNAWTTVTCGPFTVQGPSKCITSPEQKFASDKDCAMTLEIRGYGLGRVAYQRQAIGYSTDRSCSKVSNIKIVANENIPKTSVEYPTTVWDPKVPRMGAGVFYVCYRVRNKWTRIPHPGCRFEVAGAQSCAVKPDLPGTIIRINESTKVERFDLIISGVALGGHTPTDLWSYSKNDQCDIYEEHVANPYYHWSGYNQLVVKNAEMYNVPYNERSCQVTICYRMNYIWTKACSINVTVVKSYSIGPDSKNLVQRTAAGAVQTFLPCAGEAFWMKINGCGLPSTGRIAIATEPSCQSKNIVWYQTRTNATMAHTQYLFQATVSKPGRYFLCLAGTDVLPYRAIGGNAGWFEIRGVLKTAVSPVLPNWYENFQLTLEGTGLYSHDLQYNTPTQNYKRSLLYDVSMDSTCQSGLVSTRNASQQCGTITATQDGTIKDSALSLPPGIYYVCAFCYKWVPVDPFIVAGPVNFTIPRCIVANFEFVLNITGYAFRPEHYWALSTDGECQCDRLNARGARIQGNKGIAVKTITAADVDPSNDLFIQTVTQNATVGDCHSIRGCFGISTLVAAVTLREKGEYFVCYRAGEMWRRVAGTTIIVRKSRVNNYTIAPTVTNQLQVESHVEYAMRGRTISTNLTRDALRSQCNITIQIDGCGLQYGDSVAISTDACCKGPMVTGSIVPIPVNRPYVNNNNKAPRNTLSDIALSGYVYGGYVNGSNSSEFGKVSSLDNFYYNNLAVDRAYLNQSAIFGYALIKDIFNVQLVGMKLNPGTYYVCYQEYHEPMWEPVTRTYTNTNLKAAQSGAPDSFQVQRGNLPLFKINIYLPDTFPYVDYHIYENKPKYDWHIEDHKYNASGTIPDHLYTDCPFDIVLRGETFCDQTLGFMISNSSDCHTIYKNNVWSIGDLWKSKQHKVISGSRILNVNGVPQGPAARRDDYIIWRGLTMDLAGTYYMCWKNPNQLYGYEPIPNWQFHVYDQKQLTYDVHRDGVEQHLGNQNEFCESNGMFDFKRYKKTLIRVNVHGIGVNPFNPRDRMNHQFALSTVPDCSGSCNSEDSILQDVWTSQTYDGSQKWTTGYKMSVDGAAGTQKQPYDLGTTTLEGCYEEAWRIKNTIKICALSYKFATSTSVAKCYAHPHCPSMTPVADSGYAYMSMLTPTPGYSKVLMASVQAGRYYVCYKSCDTWSPLPRSNSTYQFRPYFDVIGVQNVTFSPVANAQGLGSNEIYNMQKFDATFSGIGLNITDTVVFVNAKKFLSCNDVNRTRPRTDLGRVLDTWYNTMQVSSANYYQTITNDITLFEGTYRVCYFHRSCVHELPNLLVVKPTLSTCPVGGWTAGSVLNFQVHLNSDIPVSTSDRFIIIKGGCDKLNWNPADGYIREGVRVGDINRTSNTAFIKNYTIPLANTMGAVQEIVSVCYVPLREKLCGYPWRTLQMCTITNCLTYTDVGTNSIMNFGDKPFTVGTMHVPAFFCTGVVQGLTVNLVPYSKNVTCDSPSTWPSTSIRNISITDEKKMQIYRRVDFNISAFCKSDLYRMCLYRPNRTKDTSKACCDRETLQTLIYDTKKIIRVQGTFRCICTRTMLQHTFRVFKLLDPKGIISASVKSSWTSDIYRRPMIALDSKGDCANPEYTNIPIKQRGDTFYFESPLANIYPDGQVIGGATPASQPTWLPGNYTLCYSGGENIEAHARTWVKQGDCTLTVVGFNDTQCRSIKRNTGHWQTRMNIINAVGLSPLDRIAISQTFKNTTICVNHTVSNIPVTFDEVTKQPYFMIPPYFPVGRFHVCLSFNSGPYTRQVPIEVLPQATKVVNRNYFVYGDNTTNMIFGLRWYNYTLTHVGLDRVDRPDQDKYPLCCSSRQMAAFNLPLSTITLQTKQTTLFNKGDRQVNVGQMAKIIYTAFDYKAGLIGWVVKYDPIGNKYLVNFGNKMTCWVLPPHLVGMQTIHNVTWNVQFKVPTFLMPGKYAICLRGKADTYNNYVNTDLAAEIYGFNSLRNDKTNVSLSVRGAPSRLYLENNWRKFKRIALVWLNDLNVDFTHGKYFDIPAASWETAWGTVANTWRGRSFRGPLSEGHMRQFPRCGQADQRYEFAVQTETSTGKPYVDLYKSGGVDIHAGTWAFCVMFDEPVLGKNSRDLTGQRNVAKGLDVGWYLMDGATYTIVEKFNAIDNYNHPEYKTNVSRFYANTTALYSDGYTTFNLTWIEPTKRLVVGAPTPAIDPVTSEIIGSEFVDNWETSRMRNYEKIRIVECPNGVCNQSDCQNPKPSQRVYYLGTACTGVNTIAINGTILPGRYSVCIGKWGMFVAPLTPVTIDVIGFTGVDRKAEFFDAPNEFITVSGDYGLTTGANQGVVLCYNIFGDYQDPLDKRYYSGNKLNNLAWTWDSPKITARSINNRITPDCYEKVIHLEKREKWGFQWPNGPTLRPGRVYVFFSISVNEQDIYDMYGTIANQNAMRVDVVAFSLNKYYFPIINNNYRYTSELYNRAGHRQELTRYRHERETLKDGLSIISMQRPTAIEWNTTIYGRGICYNRLFGTKETVMNTYRIGLSTKVLPNGVCSNTDYDRTTLPLQFVPTPSYGVLPDYSNITFEEGEFFGSLEYRFQHPDGRQRATSTARALDYQFAIPEKVLPGKYALCLAPEHSPSCYKASGLTVTVAGWERALSDDMTPGVRELNLVEGEMKNFTLVNAFYVDGVVVGLTKGVCDQGIPELMTTAIVTDKTTQTSTWTYRAPPNSAGSYKMCISLTPQLPHTWVEQDGSFVTISRRPADQNCDAQPLCGFEFDAQRGQIYKCKPPPTIADAPLEPPSATGL
jgi:hypothetical protein